MGTRYSTALPIIIRQGCELQSRQKLHKAVVSTFIKKKKIKIETTVLKLLLLFASRLLYSK